MHNGSNCDRKSQFSEILTEPLNPLDRYPFKEIQNGCTHKINININIFLFDSLIISENNGS